MRKVLVFQHVAHKILGTLNPTLKEHKLNIRYVNFDRTPTERPTLDRYQGLIILGGHMGVYEADKYQHIKVEMQLIEEAMKKNIPVLGICLGSQMIAEVLGSSVRKHSVKEIGWYDLEFNQIANEDPLFKHFQSTEKLFQLHGDTYDIPKDAVSMATSEQCKSQAFRYGDRVYGLQFHLEVDAPMIHRWMSYEANLQMINQSNGEFSLEKIITDTNTYIQRSVDLSLQTFSNFVELFPKKEKFALKSEHGIPQKKLKI